MKKLVVYITSGLPSFEFTKDLAVSLQESGIDTLELGIPFSDPVADGPIIEKANLLSLQNGFKVDKLFEITKDIASQIDTLYMGYFNTFYHKGFDKFVEIGKKSNLSGFIIPDLPFEEAISYQQMMRANGMTLIDFIAPTDTKERIEKIVKNAQKFIYLVAYSGITGTQKNEPLSDIIATIRDFTDTPIYIGFGVTEDNAKEKAKGVDGVIVGSALVNILLDDSLNNGEKIAKISTIAKNIKESINQ